MLRKRGAVEVARTTPWAGEVPVWRKLRLPNRYAHWGMIFILPALIFFLAFRLIPLGSAAWVSLHEWNLIAPMKWVGVANYARAVQDRDFLIAMGRSFLYAGVVVSGTVVLGLLAAVLLDQRLRFTAFYRAVYFSPALMSWVVISIVWLVMYAPTIGPFANLAALLSVPYTPPLTSAIGALPAIMIMGIWQALGFYMVVFLAGLQAIPAFLYEAASIDGAGSIRSFWTITLPLLRPVTLFAIVNATIEALQVFVQVYIMTNGGPAERTVVVVFFIYRLGFYLREMGYAAALGITLLAVVLVITLVYLRLIRTEQYY